MYNLKDTLSTEKRYIINRIKYFLQLKINVKVKVVFVYVIMYIHSHNGLFPYISMATRTTFSGTSLIAEWEIPEWIKNWVE